jgi:drug/metabolite transporter (DMT)-like permease
MEYKSENSFVMTSAIRSFFSRRLPWVALVLVWFLWGSTYLAIRVAVGTIPPLTMAGTRYVLAGAILTAALLAWKHDLLARVSTSTWRSIGIMGFSLLLLGNGMLCISEQHTPSGIAAIVVGTVPIWMVVIEAVFSRSKIVAASWIGLALGTFGVVTLAGFGGGGFSIGSVLQLIFSAIAWAAGSVYARKHGETRDNPIVPALEMIVGGLMLLVAGAMTGEFSHLKLASISAPSAFGFWWLVGPGAIVGYSAYGYAVRRLPTPVTATYAYVNPIIAVALGTILLREPLTLNVLVGGSAVVLAVIAILRPARAAETTAECRTEAA